MQRRLGGIPTFGLPIVAEGQLLGSVVISLINTEPQLSVQQWLSQIMVNYAAPILLNLRRYKELKQLVERKTQELRRHNELLRALNRIGQNISSILDEHELIEYVGREISSLLDPPSLSINLYRPEKGEIEVVFYLDEGLRREGFRFPFGKGLTSHIIKTKKPIITSDYLLECRKLGIEPVGIPSRSWLGVPMMTKGQVLGCIIVWDYIRPDTFTQQDVSILLSLANQTAIALENARLYREARRQAEEFSILYEIGLATSSNLNREALLATLYEQIRKVFKISTFYVGLVDESNKNLEIPLIIDRAKRIQSLTLPIEKAGLGGWVIKTGQSLLVRNLEKERESLPVEPIQVGELPLSWIGVPLKVNERVTGVLSIQSYEPNAFDEHELRLLEALASQLAIAFENARLFQKLSALYQNR